MITYIFVGAAGRRNNTESNLCKIGSSINNKREGIVLHSVQIELWLPEDKHHRLAAMVRNGNSGSPEELLSLIGHL